MISIIIVSITFFLLNEFCQKNKLLIDRVSFSKHKKFIEFHNKPPITGGLFIILSFLLLTFYDFKWTQLSLFLFIFVVGFFSDIFKNFSPQIRIVLQILICFFFISNNNILITDTRIDVIDNYFIIYPELSVIFTIFCFIVLINGSNFIDGVNLSSVGYFLLIFVGLIFLSEKFDVLLNRKIIFLLISLLTVVLIMNFMNKTLLGDGGVYFLGFVTSFILIEFVNTNKIASPFFAITVLWYPCFENLFSIIRKLIFKIKTSKPDNKHLHHLIYLFFKKKFKNPNNLTGISIILFNFLIIFLGISFFNDTKYLILIIFFSIIVYLFCYWFFYKMSLRQ